MTLAEMLNKGPLAQMRLANDYALEQDVSLANLMQNAGTIQDPAKVQEPHVLGNLPLDVPQPTAEDMYKLGTEQVMNMMPMAGITAYHGSPHLFNKFDMSKIGTGEGAQAYGHGLYFAENPNVAKEYSKMSPAVHASPNRTFLGKELSPGTPEYHAGTLLEQSGMTIPKAKREVQGWINEHIAQGRPHEDQDFQGWRKTLETLNQATKKSDFGLGRQDNLYKVDIPDDSIAKMLDWDKPLGEQPASVRKAINNMPVSNSGAELLAKNPTGQQIHEMLEDYGRDRLRSPKHLKEMGIPGIKYLDGGSRGTGQGTQNFVVFDDSLPQILERNGQPLTQMLMGR